VRYETAAPFVWLFFAGIQALQLYSGLRLARKPLAGALAEHGPRLCWCLLAAAQTFIPAVIVVALEVLLLGAGIALWFARHEQDQSKPFRLPLF
jgi:hypothetical protein